MVAIRKFSQMQQLLDNIESGSSPPYFAEYLLASGVPPEITLKDYPGLAFYYVVLNDSAQQSVATAWRSREFYLREGERLRAALQAPPVAAHGVIVRSAIPAKPLWKRQSALTLLLAFTSVLGALEVIRNHFNSVFDAPSLQLKWDRYSADLTEGDGFIESMGLVNDLPIPHKNVKLVGTWALNGSRAVPSVALRVSPATIAYMAAGAKNEIAVSGIAPRHGKYEMLFDVSAKAGYLADRQHFPFRRPVTVWPRRPSATLRFEAIEDPRTALMRGELSVGRAAPNGLDCELTIQRSRGLAHLESFFDFPGVLPDSARWKKSSESLPDEMATLTWIVPPVGERIVIPFKFALHKEGVTEWEQTAARSALSCYYREEKAK